jgi:opacity protein-like surface antigen
MNRYILAGVAVVALGIGSATAADMPVKAEVVETWDWSGAYFGVSAGGA